MKQKNTDINKEFDIKVFAIITLIVLAFLFGTFLFTENFVVNKTTSSKDYNSTQNNYISVGKTFQMTDKVYYVLFLDMSKYTNKTIYDDIISKYQANPIYVVDMSKDLNKTVLSDTINNNPTSLETLKLKDETLIRIEDGLVTTYIEQLKNITRELK